MDENSQSYKLMARPNILFIMTDDHASKAISAYNKTLIHTPYIDRLANEGVIFKNAFVKYKHWTSDGLTFTIHFLTLVIQMGM